MQIRSHNTIPLFLMCAPDYFKLSGPDPHYGFANDMIAKGYESYINDTGGFSQKAVLQWHDFKKLIEEKLGAETTLLEPNMHLQDQVFTADASLSLVTKQGQDITLISSMTHPLRLQEVQIHRQKIEELFPERIIDMNPFPSEGSGDNLYDPFRNLFWSGYVDRPSSERPAEGRSDRRAHAFLSKITGVDVISLQVQRPFFHIDTTLAALPLGHILAFPQGMTQDSYHKLYDKAFTPFGLDPTEYLIEVTEEEALKYSCNLIYVGRKVLMTECGERLPRLLQEKGYEVFTTNVSCFIQAGGGPHCLTNNLRLEI